PEDVHLLPLRDWWHVTGARGVHGLLDHLHLVDVAGAVREDPLGAHADDELRALERAQELVVIVQRGDAVDAHAIRALEVDEQHADLRVHEHVPETAEHAVSVVARERERVLVDDPHEARLPALVRAVRPAVGVGGGEEEHRDAFDERAVVVAERVVDGDLLEAAGDPPAVEAVLELPRPVVVHGHAATVRPLRPRGDGAYAASTSMSTSSGAWSDGSLPLRANRSTRSHRMRSTRGSVT